MKRTCIGLVLAVLALDAHALGQLADVQIVDRTSGTALEAHYYRGEYWVAGTPGGRYAVSIRNRLGERLLAVTSVDGVNVISGDTAGWQQTGYVLGPYQGYQIPGWRKSARDVAAFEFTASPNSYAERTGRPANVGVIGVALFRERPPEPAATAVPGPPPPAAETDPRAEHAPAANAARATAMGADADGRGRLAALPAPTLGTGHGARETSYVERTDFNRASERPGELIRIRYDSFANLVALGVIRDRPPLAPRPNAFPESPAGYVPDPPGHPSGGLR
jgi:hypothetical protein